MQQDVALGRRIAKRAKKQDTPMHIRILVEAIEQELDYNRFDGVAATDLIIAVCMTFWSFVEAGGSVDFGWRRPAPLDAEDTPGSESGPDA